MNSIVIPPSRLSADGQRIDTEIRVGDEKFGLYFSSDGVQLRPCAEALIAATLLVAMKHRMGRIEIDDGVDPEFLAGIEKVQDVFQSWKPNYGRVAILHAGLKETVPQDGKTGLFFSAGVDSYYSYLIQPERIDALVHLEGVDLPLENHAFRRRVQENLAAISARFSVPILNIETNIRPFHEKFSNWGFSHGSAMATISHLLSDDFSEMLIATSGNPRSRLPYGIHPDLDFNWSSAWMRIESDSFEVDRIEKSHFISQFAPVLDTLRVCLRTPTQKLNCGICEKCMRSMVYLQVTGDYDKYTVFEQPLDLNRLARYKRIGAPEYDQLYHALSELEANQRYPETARVLRKILYPPGWKQKLIVSGRKIRKFFSS